MCWKSSVPIVRDIFSVFSGLFMLPAEIWDKRGELHEIEE